MIGMGLIHECKWRVCALQHTNPLSGVDFLSLTLLLLLLFQGKNSPVYASYSESLKQDTFPVRYICSRPGLYDMMWESGMRSFI